MDLSWRARIILRCSPNGDRVVGWLAGCGDCSPAFLQVNSETESTRQPAGAIRQPCLGRLIQLTDKPTKVCSGLLGAANYIRHSNGIAGDTNKATQPADSHYSAVSRVLSVGQSSCIRAHAHLHTPTWAHRKLRPRLVVSMDNPFVYSSSRRPFSSHVRLSNIDVLSSGHCLLFAGRQSSAAGAAAGRRAAAAGRRSAGGKRNLSCH